MKKLISLFMSMVMLLSITAGLNLTANAQAIGETVKKTNYEYYVIDENSIKLTKYTCIATNFEIVVPSIIDGKKVTELGNNFLQGQRNAGCKLTLPAYLEKFDEIPIGVDSYAISEANNYFSTVDGVLFNKDKTVLIKYPNFNKATGYTVLNSVKTIGEKAFENCFHLQNVVIPYGVESIESYAFVNQDYFYAEDDNVYANSFKSFTVPSSVTKLGVNPFGIKKTILTPSKDTKPNLYYDGSALQWEKMYKASSGDLRGFYHLRASKPSQLDGFDFTVDLEKKTVSILQYFGNERSVVIPSSVEDFNVTEVLGFSGNNKAQWLTIGSNVETIYNDFGETNIESFGVVKENKNFSSPNGVIFNKNKTKLVAYPPKKSDATYKVPSTVVSISDNAFINCKNLTKISIPAKTKYINGKAFSFNKKLKSFSVSSKNKYFTTKGGVLYNKKKTKLVSYPSGKKDKTYIVPKSVKTIDVAFVGCKYLTAVKIPKSVKYFELYNVYNCFWDCTKLKKVYYAGSKSDWSKIKYHKTKDNAVAFGPHDRVQGAKFYYKAKF